MLVIAPCKIQKRWQKDHVQQRDDLQDAEIVGREVAGHRLLNVADEYARIRQRCHNDHRALERQRSPERNDRRYAQGDVGYADLELEWARLPADLSRSDVRKEDMEDSAPCRLDADRQQQQPAKIPRWRMCWRGSQAGDQQRRNKHDKRDIFEKKLNAGCDHEGPQIQWTEATSRPREHQVYLPLEEPAHGERLTVG